MAGRKSISKILSEMYDGKWKYNYHINNIWECDDGIRTVTVRKNCQCWNFKNVDKCNCGLMYTMFDGKKSFAIKISDPRLYRRGGTHTMSPEQWKKTYGS